MTGNFEPSSRHGKATVTAPVFWINDRSVENGGSGNQGNAQSDPDDDGNGPDRSNGGADKPGGPGGDDLADQDGNNGCGNDDDFEDDNEGHCRRAAVYVGGQVPDRGNSDTNE